MKRFKKIKTSPAQRQELDLQMYGPKHDCLDCGLHFRSHRDDKNLLKCEYCVEGVTLEARREQWNVEGF